MRGRSTARVWLGLSLMAACSGEGYLSESLPPPSNAEAAAILSVREILAPAGSTLDRPKVGIFRVRGKYDLRPHFVTYPDGKPKISLTFLGSNTITSPEIEQVRPFAITSANPSGEFESVGGLTRWDGVPGPIEVSMGDVTLKLPSSGAELRVGAGEARLVDASGADCDPRMMGLCPPGEYCQLVMTRQKCVSASERRFRCGRRYPTDMPVGHGADCGLCDEGHVCLERRCTKVCTTSKDCPAGQVTQPTCTIAEDGCVLPPGSPPSWGFCHL